MGDLLESADGQLRICKYVGFEPAHWVLPEPKLPQPVALESASPSAQHLGGRLMMRDVRLGDDIDDFCVRCKRVMNHNVVSVLNGEPAKVRCRTCHSDHDFRHEQAPPPKVDARKAALFNEVLKKVAPGDAPAAVDDAGLDIPELDAEARRAEVEADAEAETEPNRRSRRSRAEEEEGPSPKRAADARPRSSSHDDYATYLTRRHSTRRWRPRAASRRRRPTALSPARGSWPGTSWNSPASCTSQ